jgi:hypothetical protein
MGGAAPPLPQYAFMAWCSVRGNTGTTLPFYFMQAMKFIMQVFHDPSSSLLDPSMFLNTFLKSLQFMFLKVRDQVSHPYSTTGRITVLYILSLPGLIYGNIQSDVLHGAHMGQMRNSYISFFGKNLKKTTWET